MNAVDYGISLGKESGFIDSKVNIREVYINEQKL